MKILAGVAAMIFLVAGCATAQTNSSSNIVPFLGDIPQFHLTTNKLSDAEIQGRQLAQKLLEQQPTENFTNTGVLKIKNTEGKTIEIPIKCEAVVTATNWGIIYEIHNDWGTESLSVVHKGSAENLYHFHKDFGDSVTSKLLSSKQTIMPFANSDFWLCDLGLEFFHWPEQKILKKEVKRSRGCSVLESTNPDPSTNGYSRVVSWIDNDGGGIVQAFAYDAQGKLLKEFYPTSLKKVNGQYQVQEMEMLNDQTKSRTRLTFDLKN